MKFLMIEGTVVFGVRKRKKKRKTFETFELLCYGAVSFAF